MLWLLLIELADKYDIAFANDPDFDRHGIVTKSVGLMNPNHYLTVLLFGICFQIENLGKMILELVKLLVSSSMIDKVVKSLDKNLYEVPCGFKWFVDGLFNGSLAFGGEESWSFIFRFDGSVWSTDKDGIILKSFSC